MIASAHIAMLAPSASSDILEMRFAISSAPISISPRSFSNQRFLLLMTPRPLDEHREGDARQPV